MRMWQRLVKLKGRKGKWILSIFFYQGENLKNKHFIDILRNYTINILTILYNLNYKLMRSLIMSLISLMMIITIVSASALSIILRIVFSGYNIKNIFSYFLQDGIPASLLSPILSLNLINVTSLGWSACLIKIVRA